LHFQRSQGIIAHYLKSSK